MKYVAEIGANHMQDVDRLENLIADAARAGATHVKIQSYDENLAATNAPINGTLWDGTGLRDLYSKACMPKDLQVRAFEIARYVGVDIFATPFDESAIEWLESLDCPIYKISSFDIINLPLISAAASTGKPLIISTGMATLDEISDAVDIAQSLGCNDITLMKCTSSYPTPIDDANLRDILRLKTAFGLPVGLSDHSGTVLVPVLATALGAEVIEVHFDLSAGKTWDSEFSLNPTTFFAMVEVCKIAEKASGTSGFCRLQSEEAALRLRPSIHFARDVRAGQRITRDDVRIARPATGVEPRHLGAVVGRLASRDAKAGEPLTWGSV